MKTAKKIEKLIRKFEVETNTQKDKAVLSKLLETQTKYEKSRLSLHQSNIWRIIMKSKITKFAAAAGIIIAVFISIHQLSNSSYAGVVWADVNKKMDSVSTVIFDMTTKTTYSGNKSLLMKSEVYVAGDYGTKVDMFMNTELVMIKYRLPKKGLAYVIHPKEKQYQRIVLSEEQADKESDTDDPRQWVQMILSGKYMKLGMGNINGIEVDGIETTDPNITGSKDLSMQLWVNVETNWPVRIEIKGPKMESGQMRPTEFVMDDFQWNVFLDPNIFKPDIPGDYIQVEDTPKSQLNKSTQTEANTGKEKVIDEVKETAKTFFQACADEDWDKLREVLRSGCPINELIKEHMGGLELVSLGEPFTKSGEPGWLIHYKFKLKKGGVAEHNLGLVYDKSKGHYVVTAGF